MASPTVDLLAIKQAIVDALITGGIEQAYPCWFDNIEPPCVVVLGGDPPVVLDMAFRQGLVKLNLTLAMFAQSETIAGQQQIDQWLSIGTGSPSVIDALRPLIGGVPDSSFGIAGVTFTFGATRQTTNVIYPAGSNNRYALGELDLILSIGG